MLELATRAFNGTSHTLETRGRQRQNEYVAVLTELKNKFANAYLVAPQTGRMLS